MAVRGVPTDGLDCGRIGQHPISVPAAPPTSTKLAPSVAAYQTSLGSSALGSQNVQVEFYLYRYASAVRLDVLNAAGSVIDSSDLGASSSGSHTVSWDGLTSGGSPAPSGTYLLRITAVDAAGTHVAPTPGVDDTILGVWGVTTDVTPPQLVSYAPQGKQVSATAPVAVGFSEAVAGVDAGSLSVIDYGSGAAVAGSVSYDAGAHVAHFTPTTAWTSGHTYGSLHERHP